MPQEKHSKNNLIGFVGGGTGGHIFPLIAVAEELVQKQREFVFIGSAHSLEERLIAERGWRFVPISAGKLRRYSGLAAITQNVIDVGKTIIGFFQALTALRRYRVTTLFSKGGYVALPVVMAARLLGCRIIVHESDAVMGLSNRITARFSNRVLTAFVAESYLHHSPKYRQVGIPIRKTLRAAANLKVPKKSRPLVFVLPGSQGSVAINRLIKANIKQILKIADLVHLTGEKDAATFQELKKQLPASAQSRYKPYSFIDRELPYYFQAADLIIARSSATTIAEAALFKKATYLIPLPTAASNHQVENGLRLEKVGAAIVRQEYQLSPDLFLQEVSALLEQQNQLNALGEKLHQYFSSETAIEKIIEELDAEN